MMSASMGQFGRYHGLPSAAGGFYTTANQPGSQACLEKSFCGLLPFANSDIVEGFGCLEDGKTLAFEQLIIDAEIARMFHRVARGIEISDTTLAVDLINKVKPQGSYLTEEHTNHHLRKEHLIPVIIKRQLYETWTKDGSRSMEDVAREKVRKIIETHSIEPLDEVVQDKVAEIVRKADNKLSGLTG